MKMTTVKNPSETIDNSPTLKLRSMLQINLRTKVNSSNVDSVAFLRETEDGYGTLEVGFIGGGVYQFENVPKVVYNELVTAHSVGRYFIRNIRNKYQTKKIQ
jgi:hypothetical protein